MSMFLQEYRCQCGKLLLKGSLVSSEVEIKCKRCGRIDVIRGLNDFLDDESSFILQVYKDGKIVNASESVEKFLGYSPQELQGVEIFKIHPNFPIKIANSFLNRGGLGKNKDALTIKADNKTKDGKSVPVTAKIKFFKLDDKDFFLVIVRPSGAEDAVPNSPGKLKGACLFDFVSECNKEGIRTFFDEKVENILGYSQDETLGQPIFSFYDKNDLEKQKEIFNKFATVEFPYRITKRLVHKDGTSVIVETYMVPNYNDFGKFIGYYIINNLVS